MVLAALLRQGTQSHGRSATMQAATAARVCWARCIGGTAQLSPASLDAVVKLEELVHKSPLEVAAIWEGFHGSELAAARRTVGTVMSAKDFAVFQERAKRSPLFVLPVPKAHGTFFNIFTQVQLPYVLLTSLEEYKRYGPNAPASMTITHYSELLDSKGLALVRADIVNDKDISTAEARTLMQLLRAFYVDDADYQMVQQFNHQPASFSFDELLNKLGHVGIPLSL